MTATHPSRCRCAGTNYLHVADRTVRPCEHDWWNDDPYPDTGPLLSQHEPRAEAAYERGYRQGLAELDAIRKPRTQTP